MQILAVSGIVGAFALICVVIFLVGRSLQRRGHDLTFVDPRYPDSLQAVPPQVDFSPPRPYPPDDTSLFTDSDGTCPPLPQDPEKPS
jgi:hypothetical protein